MARLLEDVGLKFHANPAQSRVAPHQVRYVAIAVSNVYSGNKDYERVIAFFDTLYASRRLSLPLKGILIIGY